MLYRVTFGGPNDSHVHYDVEAKDSDEAFQFAYAKLQAKDRYTDAIVEEITKGPKPIGIKFESYDHYAKKSYTDYMIILAEDNATGSMLESRNLTARMSIARLRKPISLLALVMMQMRRRNSLPGLV